MKAKTTMVLIALIGVGLFALPQTTALFAGQHSFTNIDATGNQIECVKCHGDVQAELTTQGVSTVTGTNGPHADFKCEYCHRIEAGSSSGDNAYGRLSYKGTNVTRYLVVSVMDMEAGNVPASITVGDTLATAQAGPAVNGASTSNAKGNLSNCLEAKNNFTACADTTAVLTVAKPDMRIVSTYYSTNGTAKDSNPATANSGLSVSAISFTYTAVSATKAASATDVLTGAGSRAVNPGSSYHAASLVSCMECHGGDEPMGHYSRVVDGTANNGTADCSNCHYGGGSNVTGEAGQKMTSLWAGGFGLTAKPFDTGASEAHMEFVKTSDGNITRYKDEASNGACVACHTHVAVDITYTKPDTYKFDASFVSTNGTETVSGFSTTGSNISYSSGP